MYMYTSGVSESMPPGSRNSKLVVGGMYLQFVQTASLSRFTYTVFWCTVLCGGGLGSTATWVGACYVMLCVVDLTPCVVINAIWPMDSWQRLSSDLN
jgi:hypothetical protein